MPSKVQIKANRKNAQKSTGPRSAGGKAVSRFNALKSGIHAKSQVTPGEDPAELETLAADYREEYHPHTPTQIALVDSLIGGDWLQRRLRLSVARLWQQAMEGGADVGQAYQNNPAIDRAIGRMEGLKRTYHHDVWRLVEIRKEEAQEAAAQAEAAAREQREAEYRGKAAAVIEHAQLTRMLLAVKEDDGTPAYTKEQAQFTASCMQKYGVRTEEELYAAEDAERIAEGDRESAAQAGVPSGSPALSADEEEQGEAGPAAPAQCGEEGPELGSFRSNEEDSGNEVDPGDKDPR